VRFLNHTQWLTTVGATHLYERSAHRIDLSLTLPNTPKTERDPCSPPPPPRYFFVFSCTLHFIRTCLFVLHSAFLSLLTTHNTGIHAHSFNNRAAADPRLRPLGHWNRLVVTYCKNNINAKAVGYVCTVSTVKLVASGFHNSTNSLKMGFRVSPWSVACVLRALREENLTLKRKWRSCSVCRRGSVAACLIDGVVELCASHWVGGRCKVCSKQFWRSHCPFSLVWKADLYWTWTAGFLFSCNFISNVFRSNKRFWES
jgi:hypothetical protein